MTGATLLAMALMAGGMPCRDCGPDGQPLRLGPVYHHACDGGKCFSCQRPLFGGPSAPPFNYRLIFNYPWSQAPCYPAYAAAVPRPPRGSLPEPVEAVPAPPPMPPAPAAESVTMKSAGSRHTARPVVGRPDEVARKPKALPPGSPRLD
jgi:hypothetical protein